jgi:hypothetical protein
MEIVKELSQIAEKWTEPEYRARPELSYSTISTYESLGFSGLDHLFDRKESPSLLLGGLVDTAITGGEEEFNQLYTILDINVTDSGMEICKALVNQCLPFDTFDEIPESIVSEVAKGTGFWQNDKYDNTRYKQVLKTGNIKEYYNALKHSDKTIVDTATYQTALAMVRALRESPATSGYFADNDELSPIRRYYQLKFKAVIDGVGYRCMMDCVVVDYENKVIYPVDLKTSSTPEWEFEKSFVKWHYLIQALIYHKLLRINMDKDPYFKDFKLDDYRFIVVNPKTLTPLVWKFPLTQERGPFIDDDGKEWPDPFDLGKELQGYLNLRPQVPNGINLYGDNVIKCLKKK